MNSDAAAADFPSVQDDIVRFRADLSRIGIEKWQVLVRWRCERVIDRIPASIVGMPLDQWEVDDPCEFKRIANQILATRDIEPELAEKRRGPVRGTGRQPEQAVRSRARPR